MLYMGDYALRHGVTHVYVNVVHISISGLTICRTADCHAVFYLCSHWYAGKHHHQSYQITNIV